MRRKRNKSNKEISAVEIVKRYGISYQKVNHYTNFGLLPVMRKKGNIRFYNRSLVARRLREIRKLMDEGYSLRLIRKKLIGI
ncbi:MAG: helix-turn-helix domain-containing protein [Candidatus Omnitrophica bacterium]|nr:helix-turn-helix domain-containing protein [Candidatus Omnitrophota bacterium]